MSEPAKGRVIVAALSTAALGYGFMQALVSPLLPTLGRELGIDEAASAWLVTGFLLAACVATPIGGRIGDMYGRARTLRFVLAIFSLASIAAAFAPTFGVLLAARMLQGVGGALFPLAFGIVRERVAMSRLSGAIGLTSSMIAVGSGAGIVLVGPIEAVVGFHGVFALGATFVIASSALVFLVIPTVGVQHGGKVDWAGAALMVVWLSALLLCITQAARWGILSSPLLALSAATIVGFAGWLLVELRSPSPIINIRLMVSRPVMYANVLALLFGYLLFAGMVVLPSFVQSPAEGGFGFSASIAQSGFYLLPQTLVFLVVSLLAPAMHKWPGERACVVVGAVAAVLGQSLLLVAHVQPWQVVLAVTLSGAGIGLIYTHMAALIVRIVPSSETGSASGMNTNIRNIGGSIGVQVSTGLLTAFPGAVAYGLTFLSFALIAAVTVPVAVLLMRASARRL